MLFRIYWVEHMIFYFSFFNVVYMSVYTHLCVYIYIYLYIYIYTSQHVYLTLICRCWPGINPTWSWLMIFKCIVVLILIFVENIYINVHQRGWSVIFFSVCVLVWFRYQGNVSFIKWVTKHSSFIIFSKSLGRICIQYSLNIW